MRRQLGGLRLARLQRERVAAERDMIAERPQEQRRVRVGVRGEGGEEDLLLRAEVRAAAGLPEVEERLPRLLRVVGVRAAQPLGDDERVVVLPGEGHEGAVVVHGTEGGPRL